jgi:hypothetical protein
LLVEKERRDGTEKRKMNFGEATQVGSNISRKNDKICSRKEWRKRQ